MIRNITIGLVCCFAVSSCDEAKSIAEKAKDTIADQIEEVKADVFTTAPKEAKELEGLVDLTAEGYLFRKDLPFPAHVKVTESRKDRFKGRHFESNLFGQGAGKIDGTIRSRTDFERNGEKVSVQSAGSRFRPSSAAEDEEGEKDETVLTPTSSFEMIRSGTKWNQAPGKALNFSAAARWMDSDFNEVLIEQGLSPRPYWFGKRRLKIGDSFPLEGPHLRMIHPAADGGHLTLKLESIETLGGHPAGVFSMTGELDDVKVPQTGTGEAVMKISVQSGKVWLSLLYPLVLKEEIDAVMTSKSGRSKGSQSTTQGSANVTVERTWEPVGR